MNGIRTERVTLEFRIEGSPPTQWPWSYILSRSDAIKMRPGESVRVVEQTEAMKCMTKLRRERDAARAECERLRARVSELEAASAVPSWPLGWLTAEERDSVDHAADIIEDMEDDDGNSLKKKADALRAILARPSSEPRGWLTAEGRRAVAFAVKSFRGHAIAGNLKEIADQLDGLLARSSPPRVKVPPKHAAWWELLIARDGQWRDAIREAGGEVEDG